MLELTPEDKAFIERHTLYITFMDGMYAVCIHYAITVDPIDLGGGFLSVGENLHDLIQQVRFYFGEEKIN